MTTGGGVPTGVASVGKGVMGGGVPGTGGGVPTGGVVPTGGGVPGTGGGVPTGGPVSGGPTGGSVATGGDVSGGRVTPGVGARVLFVPASAVWSADMEANATIIAARHLVVDLFMIIILFALRW